MSVNRPVFTSACSTSSVYTSVYKRPGLSFIVSVSFSSMSLMSLQLISTLSLSSFDIIRRRSVLIYITA
jgi:hypothetical protein